MAINSAFGYNLGGPISGTTQYGNLVVGNIDVQYSENYGGIEWWSAPEEITGYVISTSVPGGQPIPPGVSGLAQVGFWRSKFKTNESFLDLANYIAMKNGRPPFLSTNDAEIWLESNGYYTTFNLPTPTPTTTQTPTLTNTPTVTNTPTSTTTQTPTPSITASQTQTPTPSITASQTQTPTPSITASQTQTPTLTNTPTPSITASQTVTPTPSITASQTVTPTVTKTQTPTITQTPTQTPTITQTPTQTKTPTPTAPSTLVVYYDISNSSSYPGSGSVLTDLSGAGNTGTLTGDYSYSSSNSGTIVMGGTNSLVNITQNATINISNTSTPVSVVIWAKISSSYSNLDGLWNKQLGASSYDGFRLNASTTQALMFGFNGASQNFNTPSGTNVFTANTWAMFTTVVQAGTSYVYVNGNSTPVISQATSDSFPTQANLQIGQGLQGDNAYMPMSWGQFRYYKGKALSTAEITTLFNADKTKYGL